MYIPVEGLVLEISRISLKLKKAYYITLIFIDFKNLLVNKEFLFYILRIFSKLSTLKEHLDMDDDCGFNISLSNVITRPKKRHTFCV